MLLDDGTFRVTDVITLKDRDGHPLNGMPMPLRTATTETPLDGRGKRLQQNLRGIDAEGLVRLSDGSFWVGEENAPSLAHFSARRPHDRAPCSGRHRGRVRRRAL